MAEIEDIVLSPDPRLKQVCEPIDEITPEICALAERMLDDMYEAKGCGLAAPQVGELVRLVVIDVDWADDAPKNPYVLINPKLIVADGEDREFDEGCLSFPGISVTLSRPSHVVVEAYNLDGDLMRYEAADNLMAVCLQHELDHLDGVTMVDRLSPGKKLLAMRKYHEALANGARPGDVDDE